MISKKILSKLNLKTISNLFFYVCLGSIALQGFLLRSGTQGVRDFWIDEVWRASAVANSNYYFDIDVPVQFSTFILGKLGILIFGKSTIAFKVWSQIFSIGAVLVFLKISRSLFSRSVTLIGLMLICVNIGLVEHAHESKPFSLESLLALLSILFFYNAQKEKSDRAWTNLLFVYALMSFSTTIFVFYFFVPLICLWNLRAHCKKLLTGPYVLGLLLWVVAILAINFHYYKTINHYRLFNFWKGYTFGSSEYLYDLFVRSLPGTVTKYLFSSFNFSELPYLFSFSVLVLAWIVGPAILAAKKNPICVFIWGPLVIQIILATLGKYPILSRVSTFYFPIMIFSVCISVDTLLTKKFLKTTALWEATLTILSSIVLLYILSPLHTGKTLANSIDAFSGRLTHIQEFSPLVNTLDLIGQENDILLTNSRAMMFFDFYELKKDHKFEKASLPNGLLKEANRQAYLKELKKKYSGKFIWLVVSYETKPCNLFLSDFEKRKRFQLKYNILLPGSCLLGVQVLPTPNSKGSNT